MTKFSGLLAAGAIIALGSAAQAAVVPIDDFNTDEGHFNVAPNFSGSTSNTAPTSTADRITTDSYEGAGSQEIVYNAITAGSATRIRHLSGSGTPANNASFTTSSGTDGWIGFAVKTTSPGWNVQIWLEGPENNGSFQKEITADGEWHLYEWNMDDETGGTDGWQAAGVPGIVGGDIDFANGTYTIDSVLFRHAAAPASATILWDYVARSTAGESIAIPEPTSLAVLGLGGLGLIARRRRDA